MRQKQELEAQMAQLKADLENLTPEERVQVSELLQTTPMPVPPDPQASLSKTETVLSSFTQTGTSREDGLRGDTGNKTEEEQISKEKKIVEGSEQFVEIPIEIRKMLQEAGVEGAMEWKGVPASAPQNTLDDDLFMGSEVDFQYKAHIFY